MKSQPHNNNHDISMDMLMMSYIHKSIEKCNKIHIPKDIVNNLMKPLHQNAIKYFTFLILSKRKIDEQAPITPPT